MVYFLNQKNNSIKIKQKNILKIEMAFPWIIFKGAFDMTKSRIIGAFVIIASLSSVGTFVATSASAFAEYLKLSANQPRTIAYIKTREKEKGSSLISPSAELVIYNAGKSYAENIEITFESDGKEGLSMEDAFNGLNATCKNSKWLNRSKNALAATIKN